MRWFYFVRNRLYIERKLGRSWASVAPRAAGYVLKGIRNGLPVQTLRAIHAAVAMAPRARLARMPQDALSYLNHNDKAYRESILSRLRYEMLGRVGTVSTVR
jgi:hypothetical protein